MIDEAPGNSFATDLVFDSFGNLYVETFDDRIQVFDPTGQSIRTIVSGINLSAIAIDEHDFLYLAGRATAGSGFIEKRTLEGAFIETFVADLSSEITDLAFVEVIPEPSSIALYLIACLAMSSRRKSIKVGR